MNPNRDRKSESWESSFERQLPLLGHRNWIIVADAAYPAQSNPGIETVFTGDEHTEVLGKVLDAIDASSHLRANVYVDAELKLVAEEDAPGAGALRSEMTRLLAGKNTRALAHEEIIARLDQAGRLFRILILKSTLAIPYTSVFLELDCGYWSQEAEKRLRDAQAKETVGKVQGRYSIFGNARDRKHTCKPTRPQGAATFDEPDKDYTISESGVAPLVQ